MSSTGSWTRHSLKLEDAELLAAGQQAAHTINMAPTVAASHTVRYAARDDHSIPAAAVAMPSNSVLPYTYGLTGVNVRMDNTSSTILYASIAFVCLVVFLIKFAQRANAHVRHLTNINSTAEQQGYWREDQSSWYPWVKKHIFYAPLKNKRHNREIQLSKAINVGTLPSRLQTILIILLYLSNLAYCLALDYTNPNKAATVAEFRGRTGHMSTMNMIALFLLAGRNNPLIQLIRVSYDTMNLYHRWIGRLVAIEAIAHTAAWTSNKLTASGWSGIGESLAHNSFLGTGMVATVAMTIILFHSPSPVRHAFWEIFLAWHQVLAFMALVGVICHANLGPLPQLKWCWFIACIWFFDRLCRFVRIGYLNYSKEHGMTRATAEALPGDATRVTFHMPRNWRPGPGSHVFVYFPTLSYWMSHPFSVAWVEDNESDLPMDSDVEQDPEKPRLPRKPTSSRVSLILGAKTGMTKQIHEKAKAAPNHIIELTGWLEGPYGALESLHSYGTIMLFAGGVGITHQLRHVQDLLTAYEARTAAVRRVHLVWVVKTTDNLEWVRPWMDKVLQMPCRREILQISLYVTKPKSPRDIVSPSSRVKMYSGRPKPAVLIRNEFEDRIGAMCVTICGPGALADDVRAGTRAVVDEGKCDFHEEAFTY